jgi:hypothetical protein
MNKHFIVASYNENLDWLPLIKTEESTLYIYKKGNASVPQINNCFVENLANVGREVHTYIHHICTLYPNFGDVNIFCQGSPFDHCHDFLNLVKTYNYNMCQWENFKWLSNWMFETYLTGKPHHEITLNIPDILDYLQIKYPEHWMFGPGACFFVTKERLLRNSLDYYLKIKNFLNVENYCKNVLYIENDKKYPRSSEQLYHFACIFERLWEIII